MSETPTDAFVRSFYRGEQDPRGVRPFAPSRTEFHHYNKDLYGLVEFPTKVMLVALQEVFSHTDKWKYHPDVSQTNIYIQDRFPQSTTGEAERPDLFPALITDRGTLTVANVNGRGHNRRVTTQQGEDGLVVHEDLVNCPMTVHCLAHNGPEAERLATIVFGIIVMDEPIFKRRGVHALLNVELGNEGPLAQTAHLDLVNVPVSFVMQYAWAWCRRPDGSFIDSLKDLVISPT